MKVEISGLNVSIDEAKASDWHTFSLLRKANGKGEFEQFDILMELVEYISDQTEESLVAACGGEGAQAADVIALVSQIIQAATPKN